jgi:hypothetical protein
MANEFKTKRFKASYSSRGGGRGELRGKTRDHA